MKKSERSFINFFVACGLAGVALLVLGASILTLTDTSSNVNAMNENNTFVLYHDEELGDVRVVGACVNKREGDTWTLHDEQGNAWTMEELRNMQSHGWMSLWIADNNTPEELTDDVVLEAWVEVY